MNKWYSLVEEFINTHQAGCDVTINGTDMGYIDALVDFQAFMEEKVLETGVPISEAGRLPFKFTSDLKGKSYQFSPENYVEALGSTQTALEEWDGVEEYDDYWTDVLASMQLLTFEKILNSDLLGIFTDHKNISDSDLPVIKATDFAATEGDWTADTAYEEGDVVDPTTPNGYVYECTTAGTSHSSTEPTWPTTVGGTVSDGTVTWTCKKILYVKGTDYEVDYINGIIVAIPGGDITENLQTRVKYKCIPAEGVYLPLKPGALLSRTHAITCTSTDPDTGKYIKVVYHTAEITPSGALEMGGENFWAQGITISPVYDPDHPTNPMGYIEWDL